MVGLHGTKQILKNRNCLLRFNKNQILISNKQLRPSSANRKSQASAQKNLKGGVGYRKYSGESLWLPSMKRPSWLDGSLPGDRGFDPLGLAKPVEYLQFDLDQLDQNKSVNRAGNVVGKFKSNTDEVSNEWLQPYSEVFGLQRFRECELIHGRWAMLATVGVVVAESTTGVSWVQAGKVELEGARYLNFDLPFTISQLCWIEAILVGVAEIYRNSNLDSELRIYPGGVFDPLMFATRGKVSERQLTRLREAEIKHSRLAMMSFLGFAIQALTVNEGALGSLYKFSATLQPTSSS
jgi:light-harvesting complex II chlorophyll a/b binding protein 4